MKLAAGNKSYSAGTPPVKADGLSFSQAELDLALEQRLPPLLRDVAGKTKIEEYLGGNTGFRGNRWQPPQAIFPPVQIHATKSKPASLNGEWESCQKALATPAEA